MSRKIALMTHTGRAEAVESAIELVAALLSRGLTPVLIEDARAVQLVDLLPEEFRGQVIVTQSSVPEGSELVVVLGGDGSILRAADLVRGSEIPLLGVNLGHIGFLAEAEAEEIELLGERIAAKDYSVEERMTLDIGIFTQDGETLASAWAINEATLEKVDRAKMIEVALGVDGRGLSSFGCDGIVTATPTGSTAHAFSAGGPVVWPEVEALLIVPLAAHALFARPLVVSPNSTIVIEIHQLSPSPGVLSCDGQRIIDVSAGSRLEIRRGPEPVRLARLSTAPFTDRLVGKFNLPVAGWRQQGRRRTDARRDSH